MGRGGQGVVLKGKYVGTEVAIKSMIKSSTNKLILREMEFLDKIRHPNIISIMAVSSTATQYHIVMEFFDSVSMYSLLFDASKKTLVPIYLSSKNNIAHQLCTAVAYLHLQRNPIIHRDIKPCNILINKYGFLKLCDLGMGKCSALDSNLQSSVTGSMKGTYLYMAPEIILNNEIPNESTDMWAIGCTFVELYSEQSVWKFNKVHNILIFLMDVFKKRRLPDDKGIPLFMRNNVLNCFNYISKLRPQISILLNVLEAEKRCEESSDI